MADNDNASVFRISPNDRRFSRLDINKASDNIKALVSKLVPDKLPRPMTPGGRRAVNIPDHSLLTKLSDITTSNIVDSEHLFQMLPDTELSMQILVSCILSPKDMTNTSLTYSVETGAMSTELVGAMVGVIENHFDKVYKIKSILAPILEDVLFKTGSYPLLILPENSIDDAINGPGRVALEGLRDTLDEKNNPRPMGFLGPAVKPKGGIGLESYTTNLHHHASTILEPVLVDSPLKKDSKVDLGIKVSDNFSLLKMPILRDKLRQDRIQDVLSMHNVSMEARKVSMEARKDKKDPMTPLEVEGSLYRRRNYKNIPVLSVQPSEMLGRSTVGHPLVMKLPPESIIPVHVPSNPEEHLGYFVMLDEMGNPLTKTQFTDFYTDLTSNLNSNNQMVSQLIATTNRAENGRESNRDIDLASAQRTYCDLVEEDLMNRLRNGVYGDDVEISRPTEVYRVMFARACAQMQTRLLYVPAELMTYIAFDYNKWGIGRSLLEKNRILAAIRAMMLFSNTMAGVKNSVGRVMLNITLDPNDPAPSDTVEFMIHEYAKTRQASYPLGASNPLDIISFLENAGVQVAVTGNTGYPETKLEVQDTASQKTKPDTELMEELKNQFIMGLGLSPETVNMGANAEFATTILNSNVLMTKRVMGDQAKLTGFVQDHIVKYVKYSGALMDELRNVIRENKSKLTSDEKDLMAEGKKKAEANAVPEQKAGKDDIKFDKPETVEGEDAIIMDFLHNLIVSLPSPDTVSLENQMKSFDLYAQSLDNALKAYVDAGYLTPEVLGDLSTTVEMVVAALRAYFLRQWLRTNNVFPELDILTNAGEDGEQFDLLEMEEGHMEGLMTSIKGFMDKIKTKQNELGIQAAAASDPFGNGGDGTGDDTDPLNPDATADDGTLPGADDGALPGVDDASATDTPPDDGKPDANADSEGAQNAADNKELQNDDNPKKPDPDGNKAAV
jgi:hypothetical protein